MYEFTLGELWEHLNNYPEKIVYYNENENEDDSITDESEMLEFITRYSEYALYDFIISKCGLGFKLEVNI